MCQKLYKQILIKSFASGEFEVMLVGEENQPHDAPHVVGPIGVIELHRPPFLLGREAAQHQ